MRVGVRVLMVATVLLAGCGDEAPQSAGPAESEGAPVSIGGAAASCVEEYSTETLAGRDFAFAGEVVAIAEAEADPAAEGDRDGSVRVTFGVTEWFAGGGPEAVTVDMPAAGTGSVDAPVYDEGTRLLVSGEPRFGGEPLDAPVAWGCGFTRPWDAGTAAEWRTAFAAN